MHEERNQHSPARTHACAALLLAGALGCQASPVPAVMLGRPAFGLDAESVPGQLIVGLRGQAEAAGLRGVRVLRRDAKLGVAVVAPAPGQSVAQLTALLGQDPQVAFVEPNLAFRTPRLRPIPTGQAGEAPEEPAGGAQVSDDSSTASSTDPGRSRQWHLAAARVPAAWARATGAGVTVAVIDTGVDLAHPDLQANLVEGANLLEPDTPPRDDDGHGTHVAGLIAALAGNGVAGVGVAPQAKIMPIRAVSETGGSADTVAQAITQAADQLVGVINLSLSNRRPSKEVERAIGYALWRGSSVVASMGNDGEGGNPRLYPASYPGVIAVGASDSARRVPAWSSYGEWLAVVAPGVRVWSTFPTYDCGTTRWARENPGDVPSNWVIRNDFAALSGTSQASPIVSGIVALLRSARPDLGPEQVRQALTGAARDLDPPGFDVRSGSGLVDAAAVIGVGP